MLVPTTIALLTASLVRAATHTIVVGANGNTFNPTSIITNPGDVITFSLYVALFPSILKRTDRSRYSQGGNHTPTQSTFFSLCTALQGGESSGPCVFQVPSYRSLTDHLLVCPPLLPHRVYLITPRQTTTRSGSSAQLVPTANRAWFSQLTPQLRRRLLPSRLPLKVNTTSTTRPTNTGLDPDPEIPTVRVDAPLLASVLLQVLSHLVFWPQSERFGVYACDHLHQEYQFNSY